MMEAAAGKRTIYRFPLTPDQITVLDRLRNALTQARIDEDHISRCVHLASFALFSQEKKNGAESQFTLPVNCYLVARCRGRTAWERPNVMKKQCAVLMWLNRGIMLFEMHLRMIKDNLSTHE